MGEQHGAAAPPARAQPHRRAAGTRSQRQAAAELPCRSQPELFFAEAPDQVQRAQALCQRCLIRSSCLAGALQRREPCGVWGGQLLLRGEIIQDKRPRGRPRKAGVAA